MGGLRGDAARMKLIGGKGSIASAFVRRKAAAIRNEDLLPVISDIRVAGATTPAQIADALNERGIAAARGGRWGAVQVRRILVRAPVVSLQDLWPAATSL